MNLKDLIDDINRFAIGNTEIEEIVEKAFELYIKPEIPKTISTSQKEEMKKIKKSFLEFAYSFPFKGVGYGGLWLVRPDIIAMGCINEYMVDGFCDMPNSIKEKGQDLFEGLTDLSKNVKQMRENVMGKAEEIYIISESSSVAEEVCHSLGYLHTQGPFNYKDRKTFFLNFVKLEPKVNAIY